jgi:hypothetical protein
MTDLTPFFQFALLLVIPGALVILLAALLWTVEPTARAVLLVDQRLAHVGT